MDEIGYLPIDDQGTNLLFQVVSARYETGSIMLTSNKAFKDWGNFSKMPLSPARFWIVSSTIVKSSQSRVKATEWLPKSNNHQRSAGDLSPITVFSAMIAITAVFRSSTALFWLPVGFSFKPLSGSDKTGLHHCWKIFFILLFTAIFASCRFAGNRVFSGPYPLSGISKCRKSGIFWCLATYHPMKKNLTAKISLEIHSPQA